MKTEKSHMMIVYLLALLISSRARLLSLAHPRYLSARAITVNCLSSHLLYHITCLPIDGQQPQAPSIARAIRKELVKAAGTQQSSAHI